MRCADSIRSSEHPACAGRATRVGLAVLVLGLLAPGLAAAQAVSQGQSAGRMELTLAGTITSSVVLTVEGSVNENGGAMTAVSGAGSRGTVNFGNFRNLGPSTGESFRAEGAVRGTYLVATIRLKTEFSGSGGARAVLDIQRAAPCGSTAGLRCDGPGSLFYAKMVERMPNQPAAWPAWDQYPDRNYGSSVFSVPDVSHVPGAGNLDDLMANGESIDHQVAVFVPDDAPEGAFSAVVAYTVTRL